MRRHRWCSDARVRNRWLLWWMQRHTLTSGQRSKSEKTRKHKAGTREPRDFGAGSRSFLITVNQRICCCDSPVSYHLTLGYLHIQFTPQHLCYACTPDTDAIHACAAGYQFFFGEKAMFEENKRQNSFEWRGAPKCFASLKSAYRLTSLRTSRNLVVSEP